MEKGEPVALICLSSLCLVIVVWLILTLPRVCLQFVIVIFPCHTHLLLQIYIQIIDTSLIKNSHLLMTKTIGVSRILAMTIHQLAGIGPEILISIRILTIITEKSDLKVSNFFCDYSQYSHTDKNFRTNSC